MEVESNVNYYQEKKEIYQRKLRMVNNILSNEGNIPGKKIPYPRKLPNSFSMAKESKKRFF